VRAFVGRELRNNKKRRKMAGKNSDIHFSGPQATLVRGERAEIRGEEYWKCVIGEVLAGSVGKSQGKKKGLSLCGLHHTARLDKMKYL
jgi:hypothetical protein